MKVSEDWLLNYKKKANAKWGMNNKLGTKKLAAKTVKPVFDKSVVMSPHSAALAELHNNPDLLKGKQEHYIQVQVFEHLQFDMPDVYDLAYAIPNGGQRPKKTAKAMKAEGQKSGYPDTGIDAACGIYHGFRCEIKSKKGTKQTSQVEYAEKLRKQGYCVVFCWGFDAVITAITEYWNLNAGGVMQQYEYK